MINSGDNKTRGDWKNLSSRVVTSYYIKCPIFYLKNVETCKEAKRMAHSIETIPEEVQTLHLLDKGP